MMTTYSSTMHTKVMLVMAILLAIPLLAAPKPAHASTTFTVNQTTDALDANLADNLCDTYLFIVGAQCTLRAAIQEANDTFGADTINFNILGPGVKTITPNTELPQITGAVTIDGYSQPGSSINTLAKGTNAKLMVQLYGAKIMDESGGLYINGPDVVARGLVINGFDHGIFAANGAANTRIVGNFIGTDPSGTNAPGKFSGVDLYDNSGVASNTVGGPTPAARNLISGNDACGVCVSFGGGNEVSGNLIGTQRDGKSPLGNSGDGVVVGTSGNIVGRAAPGYSNTIAFNGGDGVDNASNNVGNGILSNSIFSNGGLGIDLGDDGISPNDSGDADTGANNLQNYPVLTSAKKASGRTTIKGKLNSTPNMTFKVQFYKNPKGTNESKTLVGSKRLTTAASGNVSFTFSTKKAVALGNTITATATKNSTGDTSELSAPRKLVAS